MGLILSSEESRHHATSFFLMKVCRHALDHEKSARIEIPNRISHASIPRGARWRRMITLACTCMRWAGKTRTMMQ